MAIGHRDLMPATYSRTDYRQRGSNVDKQQLNLCRKLLMTLERLHPIGLSGVAITFQTLDKLGAPFAIYKSAEATGLNPS